MSIYTHQIPVISYLIAVSVNILEPRFLRGDWSERGEDEAVSVFWLLRTGMIPGHFH